METINTIAERVKSENDQTIMERAKGMMSKRYNGLGWKRCWHNPSPGEFYIQLRDDRFFKRPVSCLI